MRKSINECAVRSERDFLKQHGYTRPKIMNAPYGYDGFKAINGPIYVIKNKSNVFPDFRC